MLFQRVLLFLSKRSVSNGFFGCVCVSLVAVVLNEICRVGFFVISFLDIYIDISTQFLNHKASKLMKRIKINRFICLYEFVIIYELMLAIEK